MIQLAYLFTNFLEKQATEVLTFDLQQNILKSKKTQINSYHTKV